MHKLETKTEDLKMITTNSNFNFLKLESKLLCRIK
jgi:hypothetical protein